MNIELIKKYKTEFDHFLNGGKVICRTESDGHWHNVDNSTWEIESDIIFIINDEFSELRKALCDGKTIQVYGIIEKAPDGLQDVYGWKDVKSIKYTHTKVEYRIKPEEFKVGDFVRYIHSNNNKALRINNINCERYYFDNSEISLRLDEIIKWEPSPKELCWFTTRAAMLDGVNYAVLGYFNTIIGLDYTTTHGDTFRHCEPFINSKPSWFKD